MTMDQDEPINGLETLQPVPKFIPGRTLCGCCDYSAKEGQDRVCRFDPPKVFMFPLPTMVPTPRGPQQGTELKTFSAFPIVQDGQWCGKAIARRHHS